MKCTRKSKILSKTKVIDSFKLNQTSPGLILDLDLYLKMIYLN